MVVLSNASLNRTFGTEYFFFARQSVGTQIAQRGEYKRPATCTLQLSVVGTNSNKTSRLSRLENERRNLATEARTPAHQYKT